MTVPFLDLARLHASIRPELDAAFDRVVHGSSFVGGAEVAAFEEEFGGAHGLPAGAGCGSGTDALALTLRALGVGPGDEVIVPAMTFVATAEAVVHTGATPVIADVDPVTLLLGPEQVDAVRTDKTRAVIPVHLYGHVVPFNVLREWRESGLLVVEDAAQAHLATWRGEFVGHAGDAACFSFYPGKNLGALGDGGTVLATDQSLTEEVRRLRDHGRATKYSHDRVGWCSRLDGVQAAVLRAKLTHLSGWTNARRELAEAYRSRLHGTLVPWEDGAVHHLLVARITGSGREGCVATLREDGIESGVHYPVALSQQPSLARWSRSCPAGELAADQVLSLPMDPMMDESQVELVCAALSAVLKEP